MNTALEVAQNTVHSTVTDGDEFKVKLCRTPGEMGWKLMAIELWERKLVYYGVIKNMDNTRWPKVALMDMEGTRREVSG